MAKDAVVVVEWSPTVVSAQQYTGASYCEGLRQNEIAARTSWFTFSRYRH